MIREKRNHLGIVGEDILDKAVERLLGPHFDEQARAEGVQGAKPLRKEHGGSDLS